MNEIQELDGGSLVILIPSGGQWFNGKKYFPDGSYAWQLVDKGRVSRGSGLSASRERTIFEANQLKQAVDAK